MFGLVIVGAALAAAALWVGITIGQALDRAGRGLFGRWPRKRK